MNSTSSGSGSSRRWWYQWEQQHYLGCGMEQYSVKGAEHQVLRGQQQGAGAGAGENLEERLRERFGSIGCGYVYIFRRGSWSGVEK